MEQIDWLSLINNGLFPIFVAVFSLMKLDKTIAENTKVLRVLATKQGVELVEGERVHG